MAKFTIDGRRWDSDKMICVSKDHVEETTGIGRDGVYLTPRSKRVFVDGYSLWQGDNGGHWYEASPNQISRLANNYPELLDLVQEGEY